MGNWHVMQQAVQSASAISLIDVFNGSSEYVVTIVRAYVFPLVTNGSGSVLHTYTLNRTTMAVGGVKLNPVALDVTNVSLLDKVTAGSNRTITRTDLFRQVILSDASVTPATPQGLDSYSIMVPAAEIWNAGYGDLNVKPVYCRQGQGFDIKNNVGNVNEQLNPEIEFAVF